MDGQDRMQPADGYQQRGWQSEIPNDNPFDLYNNTGAEMPEYGPDIPEDCDGVEVRMPLAASAWIAAGGVPMPQTGSGPQSRLVPIRVGHHDPKDVQAAALSASQALKNARESELDGIWLRSPPPGSMKTIAESEPAVRKVADPDRLRMNRDRQLPPPRGNPPPESLECGLSGTGR